MSTLQPAFYHKILGELHPDKLLKNIISTDARAYAQAPLLYPSVFCTACGPTYVRRCDLAHCHRTGVHLGGREEGCHPELNSAETTRRIHLYYASENNLSAIALFTL